ncbi:sensor histidine kinase [Streptomyces sp. NPDC098781]|uniref:sensor histidine kinase n=1 Tax=Streptomyces sp. NPDC098781 TaxID=3366097 RepID=UPI003802669D
MWARTRPLLPWAAWLLWLTALLAELRYDYGANLIGSHGMAFAKLLVALFAVAAVFVSPWLGARVLPVVGALAAAASLVVSAVLRGGSEDGSASSTAHGFAEPFALLWLLMLIPLRGRRWWMSWAAPPLMWAAIVLRPIAVRVGDMSLIIALFFAVGATTVLGAGVVWRLIRVDRRRRAESLRIEQRTEFARDLHDFVAHHVTGIVVQAQGALAIAGRRPELVRPSLERIEQAGAEALTSMRHMVGMLRDTGGGEKEPALAPLAGIPEIRVLVAGFSAVGGARARLELEGSFDDLPVEITTTAHRVVMEALTNVRKHAHGCTKVQVCVARSAGAVTVGISDDGRPRGSSHGSAGGFGLKGLAERVRLIGGSIQAGPEVGGGWAVEATLPATPVPIGAPR